MNNQDILSQVQSFYDLHPYPPPVNDLEEYRQRWLDEGRRRADYHMHWPGQPYRADLKVLVAGCGTSQAAKHALRLPDCQVIGIDISEKSVRHTEELKRKYQLTNLDVYQLPIERVGELGRRFDKIICTGVLHHLPVPEKGLRALGEVLELSGAMDLMVYAAYGRAGVYMIQEYCRRLGIGHSDREIHDLAATLTALPHHHPLARLLGQSPDFQRKDALADALLNPQDRAYMVPQLFDLIESCGMTFGRWVRQASYLPQCGSMASTPHASRLAELPLREQYTAMELFRGDMLRHNVIIYCNDEPGGFNLPLFDSDEWLDFRPLRLPETTSVRQGLPAGAAAALINRSHTDPDLVLFVDSTELRLVEAIDGRRTIAGIIEHVAASKPAARPTHAQARRLFERLWQYDQVVFDLTRQDDHERD